MANYLPFNSIDHDRVYKAEDWAWYFSTFITNGVFPDPSTGLQVLADSAMTVSVQPGFGFIKGYAFRNTDAYSLTLDNADGSLNRIDRIVLRWDLANRLMELAVLKGTSSAEAVAPELTRTADKWELALADVAITKGLTTISQSNITDRRYDSALCGICAGMITQIDASTLTAQFDKFFEEYSAQVKEDYEQYTENIESYETAHKADFESWEAQFKTKNLAWEAEQWQAFSDWVASVKGLVDEETAAKLLAIVAEQEERLGFHEYMTLKNDFFEQVIDGDACPIVDDEGYAILADWKYQLQ